MPAITVANPLLLPRLERPDAEVVRRPVSRVVRAQHAIEGAGFEVWRPFPGEVSAQDADPFFLLDQLGPVEYAPNEAVGAPWHPHRGFETVTYVIDGTIEHHDSNGGGGVIGEGDTQWMTAGGGILHDEVPTETFKRNGGRTHGVQLWVNLPAKDKFTPPAYQNLEGGQVTLLASADAGALVRIIAGEIAGHRGPGSTHTPIAMAHATILPGAQLSLPWNPDYNALVYVLAGAGHVGAERRPIHTGQLAVLGAGDRLTVGAADVQDARHPAMEVLLLGGQPIREPVVQYGPFVLTTRAELQQAIEDYQAGRLGVIPDGALMPHTG